MNIAVAAVTLNIFSPFILFYFFALAAVSLAEVAPAVLAVALLAAVQLAVSLKP